MAQLKQQKREQRNSKMRLVSVQVPEKYVDDIDRLVVDGSFPNRSEAIRYAVRELLKRELWEKGE